MASFSSGLGELTYLQLCTRYGPMRAGRGVGWFASGTGAAGLFGAASWWVVRPLGVKGGLTIMSLVPLLMAAAYFVVMPDVDALKEFEAGLTGAHGGGYQAVPSADTEEDSDEEDETPTGDEQARERTSTAADAVGVSHAPTVPLSLPSELDENIRESKTVKLSFQEKMDLLKPMLIPFIAPLVLVYLFEYTINQGIAPTLIYSVPDPSQHLLLSWLIKNLHDYYVLYQTTYQAFVFLSRSSLSVLHIPPIPRSLLWLPALVQASILALLTSESLFAWFRESIARSLVIVFVGIEGIAGGWA
jgi:battenin